MDQRSHLTIAFLLGVVVTLGVALVFSHAQPVPQAQAQAAGGGTTMFAVSGTGYQSQARDIFLVLDPQSARMCIYDYRNGRLELAAVRNIEFDLRLDFWGKQTPTVAQIKKESEKGQ